MDPTYSRSRSVVLIAIGKGGVVQKVYSCVGKLWVNSVSVPSFAKYSTVPDQLQLGVREYHTPLGGLLHVHAERDVDRTGIMPPPSVGEPVNVSKQASVTTPVRSAHQRMERVRGEA